MLPSKCGDDAYRLGYSEKVSLFPFYNQFYSNSKLYKILCKYNKLTNGGANEKNSQAFTKFSYINSQYKNSNTLVLIFQIYFWQ